MVLPFSLSLENGPRILLKPAAECAKDKLRRGMGNSKHVLGRRCTMEFLSLFVCVCVCVCVCGKY